VENFDKDEKINNEVICENSNFDMFGDSPAIGQKIFKNSPSIIPQNSTIETDSEGYCEIPIGTILNGRYQIGNKLGTGVFSKVFKAKDIQEEKECAIKIIRNNEMMKRNGTKEIEILQLLSKNDLEDKFYCARLISYFEHQKFLCLVFELQGNDLSELIKKFGREGLNHFIISKRSE